MAEAKGTVHFNRFIDVSEEPGKLLQPIEGYQSLELVSLEEAIEPIVKFCPDVRRRAYIAKGNCDPPKDGLTQDESASIFLYTMEWAPRDQCLYVVLNSILRSKNRNRLITPWLLFMKLLLTALFNLRSCGMTVWRGVRLDLRKEYVVGKTYTWWGFSSCTESLHVLESESFLGQEEKRTMFSIECFNGKKIRPHSSLEEEDEILLLPGSQFIVKSHLQPSKKDPDLIIIHLQQVVPPFVLLEEPSISKKDNLPDLDKQTKVKLTITSTEPKPQHLKSDSKLSTKPIPTPVDEEKKYQIKSADEDVLRKTFLLANLSKLVCPSVNQIIQ
ncbi:unnamed protein product [Rotaria socialis]